MTKIKMKIVFDDSKHVTRRAHSSEPFHHLGLKHRRSQPCRLTRTSWLSFPCQHRHHTLLVLVGGRCLNIFSYSTFLLILVLLQCLRFHHPFGYRPCTRRAVCRGRCVCNVSCDTGFNPNSMNAARPKPGVAKNRTSIPNSFKTPIMSTASLQAPRTRLMTRKPTRFMTTLTEQWTRAGALVARRGKRLNWRSTAQSDRSCSNNLPI